MKSLSHIEAYTERGRVSVSHQSVSMTWMREAGQVVATVGQLEGYDNYQSHNVDENFIGGQDFSYVWNRLSEHMQMAIIESAVAGLIAAQQLLRFWV